MNELKYQYNEDDWIILIGKQLRSSKNSKTFSSKNKRLYCTKLVREYKEWVRPLLQAQMKKWQKMKEGKNKPFKLEIYLYRYTKRRADWCNLLQLLQDEIVNAGYINDDSIFHLTPIIKGFEIVGEKQAGVIFRLI